METILEFIARYLPYVGGVGGLITGAVALIMQLRKESREKASTQSAIDKARAEVAEIYEGMARRAAEDVIAKDARIAAMERTITELKAQMGRLLEDKLMLEKERQLQDQKIIALMEENKRIREENQRIREENVKIKRRVKVLEDTLSSKGIDIPCGDE